MASRNFQKHRFSCGMGRKWSNSGSTSPAASASIPFVKLLLFDSRLVGCWFLQIVANWLIPDHDADAFKSTQIRADQLSILDNVVDFLFGGFSKWDSVHFLHIAQYGYTYENNLAFYPLYPLLVELLTHIWYPFVPHFLLHPKYALLVTGVVSNLFFFLAAGYMLYLMTKQIFNDDIIALLATIGFAVNPASVFFSSCYSESLYSFLTWSGIFCLYRKKSSWKSVLEASMCFALSLLARSNGIMNCGYMLYSLLILVISECVKARRTSAVCLTVWKAGILAIISAVTVLLPFIYHQYYVYQIFCKAKVGFLRPEVLKLAAQNSYVLPGQLNDLHWCNKTLPLSYSAIQSRYWDVGFLGYFQMKKIPCFILAAPALFLAYSACLTFLTCARPSEISVSAVLNANMRPLPFILHVLVLCIVGLFFINVEVTTRILFSASPLLYWYFAYLVKNNLHEGTEFSLLISSDLTLWTAVRFIWKNSSYTVRLLLAYFVAYAFIGTCMHVNFLPWT